MIKFYLQPIRAIWHNFFVIKQLFAYGFFGATLGVVMSILCFCIDLIGTIVGYVLLIPVLIIFGLYKLVMLNFHW